MVLVRCSWQVLVTYSACKICLPGLCIKRLPALGLYCRHLRWRPIGGEGRGGVWREYCSGRTGQEGLAVRGGVNTDVKDPGTGPSPAQHRVMTRDRASSTRTELGPRAQSPLLRTIYIRWTYISR